MGSDFLEAPFCNNRTPVILDVTRAGKFTFIMYPLSCVHYHVIHYRVYCS